MIIDALLSIILGAAIYYFAEPIAQFARQFVDENLFRDAGNATMYRVLGIVVVILGVLWPLILYLSIRNLD